MLRGPILAGVLLASACGLVRGADPATPAGSWRFNVPNGKDEEIIFVLNFAEKDGKWSGELVGSAPKLVTVPKFKTLKVTGDAVQFTMEIDGKEFLNFDGVRSKDNKKIAGSMSIGGGNRLMIVELFPSKLKSIENTFDLLRETALQVEGAELFDIASEVLGKAGEKKIPADEVRTILDRVNKSATAFGPRWEREMTLRMAELLTSQTGFADLAVVQAKRAERLLSDDDDAVTRLAVLRAIASALAKAGKADDAKPYLAQISKMESRDYGDYVRSLPFKSTPYEGRKGKSDRAVLVEAFICADAEGCAAVELALDGLLRSYKPAEAIVLQYHLPIPRPDPLTVPDSIKRVKEYYGEQVDDVPTLFIGGKLGPPGGGSSAAAEKKYQAFRRVIDEGLEKPAGVKLGLTLAKEDKGFSAKVTVNDLEAPGEKIMLRLALAEEKLRYAGSDGVRSHHMVVRSMPGGAKGFPLTKKSSEQTVRIDPEALRESLNRFLEPFPKEERPLALKALKLVAFVQNDATREILQAIQVDLEIK